MSTGREDEAIYLAFRESPSPTRENPETGGEKQKRRPKTPRGGNTTNKALHYLPTTSRLCESISEYLATLILAPAVQFKDHPFISLFRAVALSFGRFYSRRVYSFSHHGS